MKANIFLLAPAAIFGSAVAGHGVVYLNVEQAQRAIFPGASFTAAHRTLTGEQRKAIEAAGGVPARRPQIKAWRTSGGGWFIVDEVLGKHEFITYAVGIAADDACSGSCVASTGISIETVSSPGIRPPSAPVSVPRSRRPG